MPLSPETVEALQVGRLRIAQEDDPGKLIRLKEQYEQFQWKAATEDPWYFLRVLCKTKDEHSKGEKYKTFPDKPHLKFLLSQYLEVRARPKHRRLLILKSRQMMASWFAAAINLWRCLTVPACTIGWLGKKADDTNEALDRVQIMYRELPDVVKQAHPMEAKFGLLGFTAMRDQSGRVVVGDSKICGIPQPDEFGNQVRQFTYSDFVLDEYAFQVNDEAVFHALLPALGEEGMLTVISTAAPSHFQMLFEDRVAQVLA